MKLFDWFRPKRIYALPELKAIVDILFPPIEVIEYPPRSEEEEGKIVYSDTSLDSNLEQCIVNFQDGTAGTETLDSLRFVLRELRKARLVVERTDKIRNGSYYVVDTPNNINTDMEEIQSKDINIDRL